MRMVLATFKQKNANNGQNRAFLIWLALEDGLQTNEAEELSETSDEVMSPVKSLNG